MKNCLTCRWEPEWDEGYPVFPGDPEREFTGIRGECRFPLPFCIQKKTVSRDYVEKFQREDCPAWEAKP